MSIFLDRFKTRLYYPPVDKPRLAGGKLDVAQVAGNAVEKIVKLIPAEVVAGYSALIYLASHVTDESLHIWLYGVAFLVGLIATQMVLSTFAFVAWAYLTSGKQIIPQYYDIAGAGFLVVVVTLVNGCIPIRR
jgi:hypothetical protein